ncbi:MAG: hypothetical protein AAFS10_27690 [Myxococcota bacterium]
MHFELLDVDLTTTTIHDAQVGDEDIYTGAVVQWSGYGRADRAWMFERLESALTVWISKPEAAGRWRLRSDGTPGAETYTLEHHIGGTWAAQHTWSQLDAHAQKHILDELDRVLASIQALLLIL